MTVLHGINMFRETTKTIPKAAQKAAALLRLEYGTLSALRPASRYDELAHPALTLRARRLRKWGQKRIPANQSRALRPTNPWGPGDPSAHAQKGV